jgi:hypothetical protein
MTRQSPTMKPSDEMPAHIPAHLLRPIIKAFGRDQVVLHLFGQFLERRAYDHRFALELIDKARGVAAGSWETRRLAILMLEHQILKISSAQMDQMDLLLVALKLKSEVGPRVQLDQRVIKEGYTTTQLDGFVPEFHRRLQRLERVHNGLSREKRSETAIQDFIAASRRECKLALARYLFTPKEVAARILKQVRVTSGALDVETPLPYVSDHLNQIRLRMPEFEVRILDELCKTGAIYWVSDSTSSEINSMVEYPLTTVVLVVKPPGSDIEFEFKRAGRRGNNPLNVVFYRDGWEVPPAHRLDGGAMQWLLRHEAAASARMAMIYRTVHDAPAPVSTFVSRSAVYGVPVPQGVAQVAEYFTHPRYFGGRFTAMREAMGQSVNSLRPKNATNALDAAGDLGLTVQYMAYVTPAQGVLSGTSSFRLDKIAQYLSPDGPETYFKTGLGREYTRLDGQRLADEVLDEVLGVYIAPDCEYRTHGQYVDDALGVPANRDRADVNYLGIIDQIGTFWGTLLAVRGYSWGESFVARNVGLRSVWEGGQWRVKIIFMDHDNLNLPDVGAKYFFPEEAFPGFSIDADYVVSGLTGAKPISNELDLLGAIYRVGIETMNIGQQTLFSSMKTAYRKTHSSVINNPWFHGFFDKLFVERVRDWDIFANSFLAINGDKAQAENWKKKMEKTLLEKGYTPKQTKCHIATVERYREFIQRQSFLYETEYSFLSRS